MAGGEERSTRKTLASVAGFVLGFTAVFALLGALAGTLGGALKAHQQLVNIVFRRHRGSMWLSLTEISIGVYN